MRYQPDDYDMQDEIEADANERRAQRPYMRDLMQHPDCRDPGHPGCVDCDDMMMTRKLLNANDKK